MANSLSSPPAQRRGDVADMSLAVVAGLALAFTTLFIFSVPVAGTMAASRDFAAYWATGRQLIHHANPYDREAISALEHSAGFTYKTTLLMRNPPWALPLAFPLGLFGLRVAAFLWTLLLLACFLISVRMVRRLHGSPPNRIHWLGFAFTPALICLTMGQTSLLALLGLVLFLRFHLCRPFLAGAALWLCALKPQLFLPFAAALALWIVVSRSYKLLAGAVAALTVSSALSFIMAPEAWAGYIRMMRSPDVQDQLIPCLADSMRHWLDPQAAWLQYLPAALCCIWAILYFWRNRAAWNWVSNGSVLMLVSLLSAPYCWFYDQGLAIPALLEGAYATRSRNLVTALALLVFLADAEICVVRGVYSLLWLWTTPAWLAWYLVARSSARSAGDALLATPA